MMRGGAPRVVLTVVSVGPVARLRVWSRGRALTTLVTGPGLIPLGSVPQPFRPRAPGALWRDRRVRPTPPRPQGHLALRRPGQPRRRHRRRLGRALGARAARRRPRAGPPLRR